MSAAYTINGFSLYSVLSNSRELLSSKLYDKAMQESGLDRFDDLSVLLVSDKVATAQELGSFWQSIYGQVPDTTFKLLQYNVGDKMAVAMQQFAPLATVRENFLALPKEQRLGEAVAYIVPSGPMGFQPHEHGYLLFFTDCPFICQNLKTNEAICLLYENMYLKMLKWFTALPLASKEISCRAMGDNRCAYYFRSL